MAKQVEPNRNPTPFSLPEKGSRNRKQRHKGKSRKAAFPGEDPVRKEVPKWGTRRGG